MGRLDRVTALTMVVLSVVLSSAAHADMLKAGDDFPSWTLPDQTGKTVSSTDLAGRTYLLWFFPKAMTPGCTKEGQGLRDRHTALTSLSLVIYGVSFDEPSTNAEFIKREGFPFALLSDRDETLATKVGAKMFGLPLARRVSYLVGTDGKVRKAYDSVDPGTHAAEVERDLRALTPASKPAQPQRTGE
jgi:peroxiredoxin Q/BCP